MHHALQIEEILLNIFGYCNNVVGQVRWDAALARTCRTFKDPALDVIWAELSDLTPLVRCLPEEFWVGSKGTYSLRKRLEQTEWDIILGYTRRVRSLPRLRGSFGLSVDCIEALANPPTFIESIFPNLRDVQLYLSEARIAPLLRHLASHNLTSIRIYDYTENLGSAVKFFGEKCPLVTNFYMTQRTSADSHTISGLVCHWQKLHSLTCMGIGLNFDALSRLSGFHNLLYMHLELHDAVDQAYAAQSPSFTLTYPTLQRVFIYSVSLTRTWRLLRHIRLPRVHNLAVSFHIRPSASDLVSFFVALQDACTHDSLSDLSLTSRTFREVSKSPCYITFDLLHLLTVFVNIRAIVLDMSYGADMSESDFLSLASSWPHLERFEIGDDGDWTESSSLTPGGFLQLLQRCRSLSLLDFMLDTRGYTEIPRGHPWGGLTMPQDSLVHIFYSKIEEESIEALAVFFHVAPYPRFLLATGWTHNSSPENLQLENFDLYRTRWQKVASLARELSEARRDLRQSLMDRFSRQQSQ